MSRRRYGYSGVTKLRKTLRRLEPEAVSGIKDVFRRGAETIHYDALVNLQSKLSGAGFGDLERSMAIAYGRDGLTVVIGPGADTVKINKSPFNTSLYVSDKGKHEAWQFFKGYWFEFGTKGYPRKNIPAQRARPFMQPAFDANKGWISKEMKSAIHDTLVSLTSGPDSDV